MVGSLDPMRVNHIRSIGELGTMNDNIVGSSDLMDVIIIEESGPIKTIIVGSSDPIVVRIIGELQPIRT